MRIAAFVAAVSMPPRLDGNHLAGPQEPAKRRMLAVLAGHHPMNFAARRRLNEKRIDAAAVVANDDRALPVRQRQPIVPPRPPQKLAQQIGQPPQQALQRIHPAAGERHHERIPPATAPAGQRNSSRGNLGRVQEVSIRDLAMAGASVYLATAGSKEWHARQANLGPARLVLAGTLSGDSACDTAGAARGRVRRAIQLGRTQSRSAASGRTGRSPAELPAEERQLVVAPCGGREVLAIALPLIVQTCFWSIMWFIDRLYLTLVLAGGDGRRPARRACIIWTMICLPRDRLVRQHVRRPVLRRRAATTASASP